MKAPAFQFYAADFLADKNVAVMGAAEVGAYILLISYCWREGSLPDDAEELAALARMPLEQFEKSWEKRIRRCFELSAEGQWTHPRLEEERQKQADNREKKRHAANVRHHAGAPPKVEPSAPSDNAPAMQTDSTRNAGEYQTQCPSSASSSSTAKENHSAKAGADAPRSRAPDMVWGVGVQMLVSTGMTEPNARTYLGSLSKKHGKENLAQAIATTSAQNPVNPTEYLVKVLEGKQNGAPNKAGKGGSYNQRANAALDQIYGPEPVSRARHGVD
jgi:uncharacterized protein YdaU (DUF1376 family)